MKTDSLAASLITTFSTVEKRNFGYFLDRPERKIRTEVKELGKLLLGKKPPTEVQVANAIGGEIPLDPTWINQLNSWLYVELKAFLHERLHSTIDEFTLIRELDRRNLKGHRDRLFRKQKKRLTGNESTLQERYEFEQLAGELTDNENRTQSGNLQQTDSLLDRRLIQEKLRQACLMQAHENVFPSNYDYGILTVLLPYIKAEELYSEPGIGAYYHALRFLREPAAKDDYSVFSRLIDEFPNAFTATELRELYLLAINFCIRQVNQGDRNAAREVLDLYRRGLERSIFLESGYLTAHTYRNAVAVSLSLKEFDWAESFIHEWNGKLPKEVRDKLLHYNLAKLAYAKGDTYTALDELRFVRSRDTLFILSSDVFRAKIYYEQKEFDLLDAHLDKMQVFLRRNQGGYHHRHYLNFVLFCRKLTALAKHQRVELATLQAAIEHEPEVNERGWLLSRVMKK